MGHLVVVERHERPLDHPGRAPLRVSPCPHTGRIPRDGQVQRRDRRLVYLRPSHAAADLPPALRALLDAGGTLLERSANGRVALGRAARHRRAGPAAAAAATARGAAGARPRGGERAARRPSGSSGCCATRGAARPGACSTRWTSTRRWPSRRSRRSIARELDGAPVAVKVRRPGLDAGIRADLALLDALRPPLGAVVPRLDSGRLLAQIREQALDELDLEHEAAQQRAVRRALARVDGIVVPAAHGELAAAEVSVSDWLEGPSLAQRTPADPDATARALVAAHLTAARAGLILIDPRPNHVLLLPGGAVGLLGDRHRGGGRPRAAGCAARRCPPRCATRIPRRSRRSSAIGSASSPARRRPPRRTPSSARCSGRWSPARCGSTAARRGRSASARSTSCPRRSRCLAAGSPDPADVWLARGTFQLAAVLAQVGARADWVALAG